MNGIAVVLYMRKIVSSGVIYIGIALIAVLAIPICLFGILAAMVWAATEAIVSAIEPGENNIK